MIVRNQGSAKRSRILAVIAIGVAAAAFAVIAGSGIGNNLVYYWGPTDIHTAGDKAVGATIRLGGMVKAKSIVHAGNSSDLEFDVTDGTNIVHVKSHGVAPQMFREGIGVVVEGTMTRNGCFESNRMLVSHNNEYRTPHDPKKASAREMMRSTVGLDATKGSL